MSPWPFSCVLDRYLIPDCYSAVREKRRRTSTRQLLVRIYKGVRKCHTRYIGLAYCLARSEERPKRTRESVMKSLTKAVPSETRRSAQSLLRLPVVKARTGLSRSSIYAMVAAGEFPSQIPIGKRAVGFLESEIDAWISGRIEACRGAA